jgi:hypothetical protein
MHHGMDVAIDLSCINIQCGCSAGSSPHTRHLLLLLFR